MLISTDKNGIHSYLSDFNETLSDVCTPFLKTCNTNSSNQYDVKRENPWFNEECEKKRYIFLQKLNLFHANKDAESRMAMTRARSDYKKTIHKARYESDKQNALRFEQGKLIDAKLYWKMLKEFGNLKSSSDINLSTSERNFKAINNPSDPVLTPDEDVLFFLMRDMYKANYKLCSVNGI